MISFYNYVYIFLKFEIFLFFLYLGIQAGFKVGCIQRSSIIKYGSIYD